MLNYEYPPLGGGAGVVTQNISEGLAALGHRITVVTTWFRGEQEVWHGNNLKVIRLKSRRKRKFGSEIWEMISWTRKCRLFLNEYCQKEVFDLCLANFSIPGGSVALHLKNKFNLKYVVLSHGHDIPWMFPRQMFFYHMLNYFRIKRISLISAKNIVLTEAMKRNIDGFLGRAHAGKNIVIPNGVNVDFFKPDHFRRTSVMKVLFVGRLVSQKDPGTFLRAVKKYTSYGTKFKVSIVGDGPFRTRMENYILDQGLKDIVTMSGWLSREELLIEYQSSHVVVVASLYEAMSLSVLEALACGCFLISTPLESVVGLIQEGVNGSFVNFKAPEEIAARLDGYYRFHGKDAVSDMENIKSRYGWGSIVKEYESHLNLNGV